MTARAPRVTMHGIAVEGHDGVAALVAILRAGELSEQKRVHHVGVHCQGKVLASLGGAARGFRQVIARILERSSLLVALIDGWAAFVRGCAAGVRAVVPNVAPLPQVIIDHASPDVACSPAPWHKQQTWPSRSTRQRPARRDSPAASAGFPRRQETTRAAWRRCRALRRRRRGCWTMRTCVRLGARARDTVVQHYSTEAICGRPAAIYNDLAGA
jgi:hypothetical protein